MRTLFFFCLTGMAMVGCSNGGSSSGDMATGGGVDMASCCGHFGDKGNELGVGKYCDTSMDCKGQMATICTTIGKPEVHSCTFLCATDGGNPCGTGASCHCNALGCGCLLDSCFPPPAGCMQ